MRQYKQIKGFTLVVISIIALLLSILMPSLSAAQDQAKRMTKQNMWQSKREALLSPFMTEQMEKSVQKVDVGLNWLDLSCIEVYGELEERINRSISRLVSLRPEVVKVNIGRYGPDFSGRWIEVMSLLSKYTGKDYEVGDIVKEMLTYQKPDGQIESPEMPFLFGQTDLPVHDYAPWKVKEFDPLDWNRAGGGRVGDW